MVNPTAHPEASCDPFTARSGAAGGGDQYLVSCECFPTRERRWFGSHPAPSIRRSGAAVWREGITACPLFPRACAGRPHSPRESPQAAGPQAESSRCCGQVIPHVTVFLLPSPGGCSALSLSQPIRGSPLPFGALPDPVPGWGWSLAPSREAGRSRASPKLLTPLQGSTSRLEAVQGRRKSQSPQPPRERGQEGGQRRGRQSRGDGCLPHLLR